MFNYLALLLEALENTHQYHIRGVLSPNIGEFFANKPLEREPKHGILPRSSKGLRKEVFLYHILEERLPSSPFHQNYIQKLWYLLKFKGFGIIMKKSFLSLSIYPLVCPNSFNYNPQHN